MAIDGGGRGGILSLLIHEIPEFADCDEVRRWGRPELEESPFLVGGALADYVARLETELAMDKTDAETKAELDSIYSVIETLASDPNPDVRNFVQVDIFENLDCGDRLMTLIVNHLLPRSRALFDEFNS